MVTSVLWVVGITAVFSLLILLYASCRVSADAGEQAGYTEEYSSDLDEGFDEEEFQSISLSQRNKKDAFTQKVALN